MLPCALLGPHHVHQLRSERAGLRHGLSYVGAPRSRTGFHTHTRVAAPGADLPASVFHPGMTIEVLGTVLGTAIQGQIVGGTTCGPGDLDAPGGGNASRFTVSTVSLEESVRVEYEFPSMLGRCNPALS